MKTPTTATSVLYPLSFYKAKKKKQAPIALAGQESDFHKENRSQFETRQKAKYKQASTRSYAKALQTKKPIIYVTRKRSQVN